MAREAVSIDQLLHKWDSFAQIMKEKLEESFSSTLRIQKPKLENETIHFEITNGVQEKEFEIHRQELLDYLRSQLNNYSLELKITKVEPKESNIIYSDEDRLKAMLKENPQLGNLIKTLGLDL